MAATTANSNSFTVGGTSIPNTIPATVTGALTIVFMFLPWLHIPLATMANSAMAFTGQGMNISPDYTILGFNDLINTFMALVPSGADAEREIAPFRYYVFFWGASIVALIAGIVVNFMGKNWLIITGSVLTAIAGIAWCGIIMRAQAEIGQEVNGMQVFTLPPWPYATIIASVGTIALAAVFQKPGTPARGPVTRPVQPQPQTWQQPQPQQPQPQQPQPQPQTWQQPQQPQQQPQTWQQQPQLQPQPQPQPQRNLTIPVNPSVDTVDTSCYCPACGALVQIAVPNYSCLVNITCGGCGEKFTMEVRPRS